MFIFVPQTGLLDSGCRDIAKYGIFIFYGYVICALLIMAD